MNFLACLVIAFQFLTKHHLMLKPNWNLCTGSHIQLSISFVVLKESLAINQNFEQSCLYMIDIIAMGWKPENDWRDIQVARKPGV